MGRVTGIWALFCAACVWGFPPAVDLGAHAAQMQTLADLLAGDAHTRAWYRPAWSFGYGGTTWLFAPVAYLIHGAFAARLATWLAIFLLPLSAAALARAFGRSASIALLVAPFSFGVSYWYGFVPTTFALPWLMFAWGGFVRLTEDRDAFVKRDLVAVAGLSALVMALHIVVFGALVVGLAAIALASRHRRTALGRAALVLAPAALLSLPRVAELAGRALRPGPATKTEYDADGHLNWFLKAYDLDGRIALWCALGVVALFIVSAVARGVGDDRRPLALLIAMAALYAVTPKAISGAWLIYPRLAVLAGIASLMIVDLRRLHPGARVLAMALTLVALGTVASRHVRFAKAIEGLDEITAMPPPPGVHGGFSLAGLQLPGSRITLLEHLPQWWTARHGGVGTHFFADADHQPVRFVEGRELPALTTPEAGLPLERFTSVLVFGDGPPPPELSGFSLVQQAGRWRRFDRGLPSAH